MHTLFEGEGLSEKVCFVHSYKHCQLWKAPKANTFNTILGGRAEK